MAKDWGVWVGDEGSGCKVSEFGYEATGGLLALDGGI